MSKEKRKKKHSIYCLKFIKCKLIKKKDERQNFIHDVVYQCNTLVHAPEPTHSNGHTFHRIFFFCYVKYSQHTPNISIIQFDSISIFKAYFTFKRYERKIKQKMKKKK